MNDSVKIASIGIYLPEEKLSNHNKAIKFGYDDSFLENKLGFTSTRIKTQDDTIINMCLKSFQDLRRNIAFDIKEIQVITVVTQNPTIQIPHTSALIHNALGLSKDCMTFDISQGCSGYCHAIQIVNSLMDSLHLDSGLVFTCDSYREIMDDEDKNVSMIFGDAATVSLLSRNEKNGYILVDSIFGTAPDSNSCLIIKEGKIQMHGFNVFQFAKRYVPDSIDTITKRNDLSMDQVDLFLLHQGSKHIVETLIREMNIEPAKAEFSSKEIGNTISSSIPIQLADKFTDNSDTNVIIGGFGVGFTWATCLLKYI